METPYRNVGGATVEHPEEASAGQYFELFWTIELLDKLKTETNIYACKNERKTHPLHSQPSGCLWNQMK